MIVPNMNLVIFLIPLTLKMINISQNKLMPIFKISLFFLNILQIIINLLIIKSVQYTLQINSKSHRNSNFKRKDHTSVKASYNKS